MRVAEKYKVDENLTYEEMDTLIRKRDFSFYWHVKRLTDSFLALIGLIVLLPIMLPITLAIFLSDPSCSPIYSQKRVGRHGKEFTFYKFRTMVPNADELLDAIRDKNEMDGPVFKIKDDPRITPIGKFLRSTSLDELPQLINILRGDMVIVGPRPPLPSEVAQYSRIQMLRLSVTPGLTCYWQVQPRRNEISFERWVEMDLYYILHRCIHVDLEIILMTIRSMLCRDGR